MTRLLSIRTEIEDAVIRELRALTVSRPGGYLRAVKPYQGSLTPSADDEDLNRVLLGQSPAILVTTGDSTFERDTVSNRKSTRDLELHLIIVSSMLRSQEAKARGDDQSRDPGVYRILEDCVRQLMMKEFLVTGASFALPRSETVIARDADKAIWLFTWGIKTDVIATAADELDGDYATLRGQINNADDDTIDPVIEFDRTLDTS